MPVAENKLALTKLLGIPEHRSVMNSNVENLLSLIGAAMNDPSNMMISGPMMVKGDQLSGLVPFIRDLLENPEYFARAKNLKADIVEMPPKEYVQRRAIQRGEKNKSGSVQQYKAEMAVTDSERIKEYADALKAGMEFGSREGHIGYPVLDPVTGFYEGKHRALGAAEAGLENIPVLVLKKALDNPNYIDWLMKIEGKVK